RRADQHPLEARLRARPGEEGTPALQGPQAAHALREAAGRDEEEHGPQPGAGVSPRDGEAPVEPACTPSACRCEDDVRPNETAAVARPRADLAVQARSAGASPSRDGPWHLQSLTSLLASAFTSRSSFATGPRAFSANLVGGTSLLEVFK